ncbi:MAG: hypothetical protein M3388_10245 [Acidobacteriota bacterium]|nr:hypothetical protein [Acidobacteriota bacterium]
MPPRKVKFYFEVWLCVVLSAMIFSCGGKTADETNSNADLTLAPEAPVISESKKSRLPATKFERNLPADFLPAADDAMANRLLKDYGAMFVARGGAVPPPKIVFENGAECADWQNRIAVRRENFGGINVELQTAAMTALINAREELRARNLPVTARGAITTTRWKSGGRALFRRWIIGRGADV